MKLKLELPNIPKVYLILASAGISIGTAINSIMLKLSSTHLSAFITKELMTEAHQKWYCIPTPSYLTDAIMVGIGIILTILFVKEVTTNESNDPSSEV